MKTEKLQILLFISINLLLLGPLSTVSAQIPNNNANADQNLSGGTFTITKTVIAGGGASSQHQLFEIQATSGQAVAGRVSTGGQFSLASGFWTPENFAPTAASVKVGGRVMTQRGAGIRNATVTITSASGETRSTVSGTFGYFSFGDIEVGASYIFTVSSKRFVFSNPALVLTINEERDDIDFITVK
jgi:hypothetical protein